MCVRAESRGAGSGTVGCGCSSLAAGSAPQWYRRDGLCGPFLHANSTQIFKTTLPLPLSLLPLSLPPSLLSLSLSLSLLMGKEKRVKCTTRISHSNSLVLNTFKYEQRKVRDKLIVKTICSKYTLRMHTLLRPRL